MAHLYDDDSDEEFADYENVGGIGGYGGQPMYGGQPSFGGAVGGPSSIGGPSTFGGSNFGAGGYNPGGFGGGGFAPSAGIGFGQASQFGGIGGGNPFMSQPTSAFGGDALATDYVDLSKVKAPEVNKHQPNKFATSAKSSMRKAEKKKGGRGVSFGEVTTFHVDKESEATESEKKQKSDNDDSDEDEDDEDDIENEALNKKLAENKKKEEQKTGKIADMMKKISNLEESITESGSMGLKKSIDSDDYKISSSHDAIAKKKGAKNLKKQRSPTGLSDSDDPAHFKSQDLDSNKKLSSEYDSAELSRNFNYDESEETSKGKFKFDKSKKSEDETEYDDDFEESSKLHQSSSLGHNKKSKEAFDEIEAIRKRNMDYKSNLDSFKSGLKSEEEHEESISKQLDSYRANDKIKEESEISTPLSSSRNDPSRFSNENLKSNKGPKNYEEMRQASPDNYATELKSRHNEMDAQVSRIEAQNAVETNKMYKERINGYIQDINQYRVEIEHLKRQIDVADSNSQSKDQEIKQITDEYETKLKLERERNANTNVRQESREINELKREVRLLKSAHEQDTREKFEEIDYLTKRCEKLEAENVALRVGSQAIRDAEKKAKTYEEEVHSLRMRLREQQTKKDAPPTLGSNYNNWNKEQLIKELISIDNAISRFTKENESLMHENRKQKEDIQELNALLYKESQKLQDYRHKIVKETGSVMIVEDEKDLHARVLNDLGIDHAISLKEFNEIKEKLFKTESINSERAQEMQMREIEYKKELDNIREQKVEAERKLISLDSALRTQIEQYEALKEQFGHTTSDLKAEKAEVQQKLEWYMENQGMLDSDIQELRKKDERIDELKEEIRQLKLKTGDRRRVNALEKQVKDLQDALAKKHPDSIPMMLSAVKPSVEEQDEYRRLRQENDKLKKTLQEKDDEFDKKLRNLRTDMDKVKNKYDKTKAMPIPGDVKDQRIYDLERQVQETKDYYQDRIKKLQQNTKSNDRVSNIKDEMKYLKEIETYKKELDSVNKSKKMLDKDIRGMKTKMKDRPADLVLAINALMDEDYVFCLCSLYKSTLGIKKMLEKNAKFETTLKAVENLIDQFQKASEKFKSSKAMKLFSKITDKCIELSKIIESSESKKDKSKPHSKLTAIEHLLKEEIESAIGASLDKNTDLQVVDIDDSVGAGFSQKKSSKKKYDEDEYWSDFSDDDYTNEVNEEKKASEVLLSLQRWVYNSNLEQDLKESYPNRDVISLDELKDALSDAGYHCELLDLQALLKRLDISHEEGVNYKQLLANLAEKNAAWWKQSLSNNGFDITAKGKRDGNYRPLCNKAVYEFIQTNLGDKTKQAINRAGYLDIGELINEIFENHSGGLSKRNLRKEFLDKRVPLTRLDTHILFKTLADSETNVVKKKDFKMYVQDSSEFMIARGMDMVGSAPPVWIDEEVNGRQSESGEMGKYQEELNNLVAH